MIRGAAFPPLVRLLATALVAVTLLYALDVAGPVTASPRAVGAVFLIAAMLVFALWCLYWIWRSTVEIDEEGIRQTWLWKKRVLWRDVTQARLVAIPGLAWLVAPRLVLRARGAPAALVFHVGNGPVLQALTDRLRK